MYSNRDVTKGEIIKVFVPGNIIPACPLKRARRDSSLFGIDLCNSCGRAIWTNINVTNLPNVERLPKFNLDSIYWNPHHQIGECYCSSSCKESFDEILNFGTEARKFFKRLHGTYDGIDYYALLFASILYRKVLAGQVDPASFQQYESNEADAVLDEQIRNCWVILQSDHTLTRDGTSIRAVSIYTFHAIFKFIRQKCVYQVTKIHPIQQYIQSTLLKLSDRELADSFEILKFHLPIVLSETDEDAGTVSSNVLIWRMAARIRQATCANGLDDEELDCLVDRKTRICIKNMFHTFYCYCPNTADLQHSCMPNALIEAQDDDKGGIGLALVALHNIKRGDKLTVSKIEDIGGDISERQSQLESVFGKGFLCQCHRCRYERCLEKGERMIQLREDHDLADENDHTNTFHWLDLKNMADLAMQHARFKTAYKLYTIILNYHPKLGDVLHARCASVLEGGNFIQSQRLWKEAFDRCPSHEGISLQVKKQDAYKQDIDEISNTFPDCNVPDHMNSSIPSFITLIPSQFYVTSPDSPLISPDECSKAIELAESAAKSRADGWTTSRHYAVPTTDIPVHEIPQLLKWFNDLLHHRIKPLMAAQFGEYTVGKQGRHIFIHDSFIVRYDASGGQKHLPLHRDQSTHSFTIALNATSDYDGGGTYVAALKRSIRPDIGGITSFRGDQLLHGGDPIVRGRRYIIVAFCYVSKPDTFGCRIHNKRLKLDLKVVEDEEEQHAPQNTNHKFSFGFTFG